MTAHPNHSVLQTLKNWMLPLAMILGGVFYPFFSSLAFLTPYLIFLMLLAPYCKLSPSDLRIRPWHLILLSIQIAGGLALYTALRPAGEVLAQGAFICVLAPTATSAAVVTGMLGGDVASLATYCLLGNVSVAVVRHGVPSNRSAAHSAAGRRTVAPALGTPHPPHAAKPADRIVLPVGPLADDRHG